MKSITVLDSAFIARKIKLVYHLAHMFSRIG